MSAARSPAETTLARLGLDADALREGRVAEDAVASLLTGADGVALASALGELATPAVATLLVALEPRVHDRTVHKEVRRALYRLRQRGVSIPEVTAAAPAPGPTTDVAAEGLVSAFDGRGDRLVWIIRALAGGGSLLVAAQLNEPGGLGDVHAIEGGRKHFRTVRQRMESEARIRLVPASWRTLDALLVEAHERGGGGERARDHDYLRVRPRLTTDPALPPAEPTSSRAAPPTDDEARTLAATSASLLEEPELRTWYPSPEAAAPFVDELAAARESPLVVSRMAQEDRMREVLRRAARALYPSAVMARRLAGTAYVLAETGRVPAARRALAVAHVLGDVSADPLGVPLLAALVEGGVGSLLAEATAGDQDPHLVVTPGQFMRDRSSSRPRRT